MKGKSESVVVGKFRERIEYYSSVFVEDMCKVQNKIGFSGYSS